MSVYMRLCITTQLTTLLPPYCFYGELMSYIMEMHSALQWGLPLDLLFYFSKDLKHFGRTFLSLTSNLEQKFSQLLLLSWILQLMSVILHFANLNRHISGKIIVNYWT